MPLFHFWVTVSLNGIEIWTWISVVILSESETLNATLTWSVTWNGTCVVVTETLTWNETVIWSGCALIVNQSETWSEIGFWILSGSWNENVSVSENVGSPAGIKIPAVSTLLYV